MGKYYKAGVGFVDPDWKQIEDLRKMLKEMVFQFEGLVQYVSEEDYMDDELEALFVALLKDARETLYANHTPDCNQTRFEYYKNAEGRECDCGKDDPAHRWSAEWRPVKKPPLGGVVVSKLWREDIANMRRILLLHGRHRVRCCTSYDSPVWHPEEDCDCGWREIYTDLRLYEPDPSGP